MKKIYVALLVIAAVIMGAVFHAQINKAGSFLLSSSSTLFANTTDASKKKKDNSVTIIKSKENSKENVQTGEYKFPDFYRGIYLNISSARNFYRLKRFVRLAKKSYINAMVLDVQTHRYAKCVIPKKYVEYVKKNGIHPIARIVVFPAGLAYFPVSKRLIQSKLDIAESACLNGFKEIQFDYIRFNDSNRLRHLSLPQRYAFIEGFIRKAKNHLKKYNIKIAADVFGRIPLNKNDLIGQRMEGLDKVCDIICPMAYPSHYTWSRKLQYNPYYTVLKTSKMANKRTKNAQIVSWIQGFRMRLGPVPFPKYIRDQIKACHDAKIRGFIIWNARQLYHVPFKVTKDYYSKRLNKL